MSSNVVVMEAENDFKVGDAVYWNPNEKALRASQLATSGEWGIAVNDSICAFEARGKVSHSVQVEL